MTEPVLRPIRNALPDLGAIDLSPLVLLLVCFFIQIVVSRILAKLFAPETGAGCPWRAGPGCVIVRVRVTPKSS